VIPMPPLVSSWQWLHSRLLQQIRRRHKAPRCRTAAAAVRQGASTIAHPLPAVRRYQQWGTPLYPLPSRIQVRGGHSVRCGKLRPVCCKAFYVFMTPR
jgi:hypothetical protein